MGVGLLLELNCSSAAHCGAAKGQLATLKVLHRENSDSLWLENNRGDVPLHEAVHSGRKDLVRWMLAGRPDATAASNNEGRCPLHVAALNNSVEMCKVSKVTDSLSHDLGNDCLEHVWRGVALICFATLALPRSCSTTGRT